MFKVFNRKKSNTAPTTTISIGSPAPLGTQHQRATNPPPLYARFATRGESIDSSNPSLSLPSTPQTLPSSEDLRAEYTKAVVNKESRFYRNESVTRFGSASGLPGSVSPNGSSRDLRNALNNETGEATKGAGPSSRLNGVTSRSATGPVHLRSRGDEYSSDPPLQPPRAPAMHSNQSSSSIGSISDASSIETPSRRAVRRVSKLPPNPPPEPSTSIDQLEQAVTISLVPPSARHETSQETLRRPAPPPQADRSSFVAKALPNPPNIDLPPAPAKTTARTPSASTLVHPSMKRSQGSAPPSVSASSLVHPSQRLRSTSSSVIPTRAPMNGTAVLPSPSPIILPPAAEAAVVQSLSTEPPCIPTNLSPTMKEPQLSSPLPPVKPFVTVPKPSLQEPTLSASPESGLPPSSFNEPDLLPAAVKAARRRSIEFGTYDIEAARRERERLDPNGTRNEAPSARTSPVGLATKALPAVPPKIDVERSTPTARRMSRALPYPTLKRASVVTDTLPATELLGPVTRSSAGTIRPLSSNSSQPLKAVPSVETMGTTVNPDTHLASAGNVHLDKSIMNPSQDTAPQPDSQGSSYSSHQSSSALSQPPSSSAFSTRSATTQQTDASIIFEPPPKIQARFHDTTSESSSACPDDTPRADGSPEIPPKNIRRKRILMPPPSKQPPVETPHGNRSGRVFLAPEHASPTHSGSPERVRHSPTLAADLPSLPSGAVSKRISHVQATVEEPSRTSYRQSTVSCQSSDPDVPDQTFYPLERHILDYQLLATLLPYLTFSDWLPLFSLTAATRKEMENSFEIKEAILERYLTPSIGYRRWSTERMGNRKEPISLTLRDLNSYMRGVSLPPHHYPTVADNFLTALAVSTTNSPNVARVPVPKALTNQVRMLASSTRAYTRVVLRLRAQAEAEASFTPMSDIDLRGRGPRGKDKMPATGPGTLPPTTGPGKGPSKRSSSPAFSFVSGHERQGSGSGPILSSSASAISLTPGKFKSPLYKNGHAALLRVYVPSPEGAWLSDSSVIECERELKRANALGLLKVGDVVHDLAAGDEANTGRLVWDGNYLVDLDYSYSPLGEVPKQIDSLAYPPAYFHRIIRTEGNPLVHIDLRPFAVDIANNLSLLQDRVQTETPQGSHHTVIRWIHRARFRVKPNTPINPHAHLSNGKALVQLIDPGWWGTVVVEAEGTNEGLADLQARVGKSVRLFAMKTLTGQRTSQDAGHERGTVDQSAIMEVGKAVFRLLRAQSRPGEIWLRCVREKERHG